MDRQEILDGIERLKPWFHCIDLGDGIVTKTASEGREPRDHPRDSWATISRVLPRDLTGKTVLDVGCNAGFYAFEAEKRGAERVLGVDAQRHHIRQGRFVAKALDSAVEFRRQSVYDLSAATTGEFDVVLALGLVYHLKHPVLALERLLEVTRGVLILETAVPSRRARLALPWLRPRSYDGELHSLFYVENRAGSKEAVYNWFLPTPQAMAALLRGVGFETVRVVETRNNRAVLSAQGSVERTTSLQPGGLAAAMEILEPVRTVSAGSEVRFRLRVKNVGTATWLAEGSDRPGSVDLGAHLLRGVDEIEWDWGRVALGTEIAPGEACELELRVRAPVESGSYTVALDLVAEHVAWFEDLGSEVLRLPLEVEPPSAG